MRNGIDAIDKTTRLAGIARTLQSQPLVGAPEVGREYELLFAAIDGLQPGEVLVTDRTDCCVWGELCAEAAICRGGNGAVIDGFSRDMELVRRLGFPLYCRRRAHERSALPPERLPASTNQSTVEMSRSGPATFCWGRRTGSWWFPATRLTK